jgi:hypothetical protein
MKANEPDNTKNIIKVSGLITTAAGVLLLFMGFFTHAFAFFYGGILLALFGFVIYLIGKLEHKSN